MSSEAVHFISALIKLCCEMKKKTFLIICLLNSLIACAGNIDSVLFSTDGKFVLITDVPVLYPKLQSQRKYVFHHPEIVVCFSCTAYQNICIMCKSTLCRIFKEKVFVGINT